jgi:ribosomal protein L32
MRRSDQPLQESVEQSHDQKDTDDCLRECPHCGATGLPERVDEHDCQQFLTSRSRREGETQ